MSNIDQINQVVNPIAIAIKMVTGEKVTEGEKEVWIPLSYKEKLAALQEAWAQRDLKLKSLAVCNN